MKIDVTDLVFTAIVAVAVTALYDLKVNNPVEEKLAQRLDAVEKKIARRGGE